MNAISRVALLVCLLGVPQAAEAANPIVCHSTADCTDPGDPAPMEMTGSDEIDLYINVPGGQETSVGTICRDGDGDELCGIDVIVEITGGGIFTDFSGGPSGIVHDPAWLSFDNSVDFRLNVLQTTSPPSPPGPQYLGTLTVDNTGAVSSSVTARGQAVGADLELMDIPLRVIAVPEPAELLLLGIGILGLAGLDRLRRETRPGLDPPRL